MVLVADRRVEPGAVVVHARDDGAGVDAVFAADGLLHHRRAAIQTACGFARGDKRMGEDLLVVLDAVVDDARVPVPPDELPPREHGDEEAQNAGVEEPRRVRPAVDAADVEEVFRVDVLKATQSLAVVVGGEGVAVVLQREERGDEVDGVDEHRRQPQAQAALLAQHDPLHRRLDARVCLVEALGPSAATHVPAV